MYICKILVSCNKLHWRDTVTLHCIHLYLKIVEKPICYHVVFGSFTKNASVYFISLLVKKMYNPQWHSLVDFRRLNLFNKYFTYHYTCLHYQCIHDHMYICKILLCCYMLHWRDMVTLHCIHLYLKKIEKPICCCFRLFTKNPYVWIHFSFG